MTPVQEATAISDLGLEGDRHAIQGSPRQVLVMDKETLDSLNLPMGVIKENITIEGLDFSSITAGQVFFLGDEVTLEATGPCEPCTRMDEIRPGLRETLDGRRGIITMVLNGGTLRVNDTVRVEPSREALLTEAAG
jgi:MOSC domain-containing protein YiiM